MQILGPMTRNKTSERLVWPCNGNARLISESHNKKGLFSGSFAKDPGEHRHLVTVSRALRAQDVKPNEHTERYIPTRSPPSDAPADQMAETPVLQMRSISKSFGAGRVLTNVHLELRKGEIHALQSSIKNSVWCRNSTWTKISFWARSAFAPCFS